MNHIILNTVVSLRHALFMPTVLNRLRLCRILYYYRLQKGTQKRIINKNKKVLLA